MDNVIKYSILFHSYLLLVSSYFTNCEEYDLCNHNLIGPSSPFLEALEPSLGIPFSQTPEPINRCKSLDPSTPLMSSSPENGSSILLCSNDVFCLVLSV